MQLYYDLTFYLCCCSIELDRYDLPFKENISPVLQVANLGHAMHAFVNGEYVGKDSASFA